MMTNLFSIFDSSMALFSLSYIMLFVFLFFPFLFWCTNNFSFVFSKFLEGGMKEISFSLNKMSKGINKFIMSIFLFIGLMNFLAIFPMFFSLTSHLMFTLPLSYSFWTGIIFFSFFKSFIDFLCHLVPLGTPLALISFMSLVELTSIFIRPLALMFRLTANMVAGHLLMSLIGGVLLFLPLIGFFFGSLIFSLLVLMELGVSIIQSYVFSTLLVLYISEMD